MDVQVIQENTRQNGAQLETGNGLSLLVTRGGKRILFDTGLGSRAINNARRLGIDLPQVDVAAISHGHFDHTGGLPQFLQVNAKAPVYLKKEALDPHFVKILFLRNSIGMDASMAQRYPGRMRFVDARTEIAPGVFVAPVRQTFPVPSMSQNFLTFDGSYMVPDTWKHELLMAVRENGKLAVITGCGHTGVRNIVTSAKEAFPGERIGTVIGGFHFVMPLRGRDIAMRKAPRAEVEETARWLQAEGVEKVYTGHCTGNFGVEVMRQVLRDRLVRLYTGQQFVV